MAVNGTQDDILLGTVGQSVNGNDPLGLILQQLKIITIVLKTAYQIPDEDFQMLAAPTPNWASGVSSATTPFQSQSPL